MAFRVGVFDGKRKLFDCYMDCSVDGSLVLDVDGSVKFEQVEKAGVIAKPFDEMLWYLAALLRNRFVVLYDHENVFNVLRLELHRDQYFDVGFSRLIRNEALRSGGSFWLRALSVCAPLTELWDSVFNADMFEFGSALGQGLLKFYARVKRNTLPRAPLPAPDIVPTRRYRSTVSALLPLEVSVQMEMNANSLLKDLVLRLTCPAALPMVPRPTPSFQFGVNVATGRDKFLVQTLNALILKLPLAGVAFVKFVVSAGILTNAALKEYSVRQRSCNPRSRFDEV